jgi:hypothetical protein
MSQDVTPAQVAMLRGVKNPKKNVMKKLGAGYIWFGKQDGQKGPGYYRVSLADKDGTPVKLRISNLGAWKRVRLWAEVLKQP